MAGGLRPGQNVFGQEIDDRVGAHALVREFQRGEQGFRARGHGALDGACRQGVEVLCQHVDGAPAQALKIGAVGRQRAGRRGFVRITHDGRKYRPIDGRSLIKQFELSA